jgi:two-component system sensor histidine kinase UhpB
MTRFPKIAQRLTSKPGDRLSLFWQVFLPNAAFLVVAVVALALSPAAVNAQISVGQAVGLAAGLMAILLLNLLSIRRAVAPVEQLTEVMSEVDPLNPGKRLSDPGGSSETATLADVFNAMIERLETERRESGRLLLSAQEQERLRLARELHDEIGQELTGLILEIDHAAGQAPAEVGNELREIQETARSLSAELREIVGRLRPEALDDLGLHSALVTLTKRFSEQSGLTIHRRIERIDPPLSDDAELVIYRVGQESLTNVVRHADASQAWFELDSSPTGVRLRVADNGRGIADGRLVRGEGIRGMRERAMLIGARIRIGGRPQAGFVVELEVPAGA